MFHSCKNIMGNKENNPQGGGREAAAPLGARPKAAPLFSLFPIIFLHVWNIFLYIFLYIYIYISLYLKATPSAAGPPNASWDCWLLGFGAAGLWGCWLKGFGIAIWLYLAAIGCLGAAIWLHTGCIWLLFGCLGCPIWLHRGCVWLLFGCMGCLWLDMLQIAGWLGGPGLRERPQMLR